MRIAPPHCGKHRPACGVDSEPDALILLGMPTSKNVRSVRAKTDKAPARAGRPGASVANGRPGAPSGNGRLHSNLKEAGGQQATRPGPSHEQIARRAFQIYEAEGRPQGRDEQHWLNAETELGKVAGRI